MLDFIKKLFKKTPGDLSSMRVKDYYEQWHHRYIEGFGDVFQSARNEDMEVYFRYVLDEIGAKDNHLILDAGCGIAGPAIKMAKLENVRFEGLTISPSQVIEARNKIEQAGLNGRINVTEGDYHFIHDYFAPNTFNSILFLESLVHSDHPEKVLESAYRVLKPGGYVYIKDLFKVSVPGKGLHDRINTAQRNTNNYFCLNVQYRQKIEKILKSIGYKMVFNREVEIAKNHDVGNAFVAHHGIDIYEGEFVTYLDWAEIKCMK